MPALLFVVPFLPLPTPPVVTFAIIAGIVMLAALIWGYTTGRIVGAFSARLTRLRRAKGFCAACGYDLTANVSGVCPECGMQIRQRASN